MLTNISSNQLIVAIISAFLGGMITLKVYYIHEKRKLRMEQKVKLWNNINTRIHNFNDSFADIQLEIDKYFNNETTLENVKNILHSKINKSAEAFIKIINEMECCLLFIKNEDYMKELKKTYLELAQYNKLVLDNKKIFLVKELNDSIDTTIKEANKLYAILNVRLLEDIMDNKLKRQIIKNQKSKG